MKEPQPIMCWKRVDFEASHNLPNYQGACARMHGHTYTVEVGVTAHINPETGIAIDLKEISEWLKMHVVAVFDHRHLNDITCLQQPPTAENIAVYIRDYLNMEWPAHQVTVRVFETRDSWVELYG